MKNNMNFMKDRRSLAAIATLLVTIFLVNCAAPDANAFTSAKSAARQAARANARQNGKYQQRRNYTRNRTTQRQNNGFVPALRPGVEPRFTMTPYFVPTPIRPIRPIIIPPWPIYIEKHETGFIPDDHGTGFIPDDHGTGFIPIGAEMGAGAPVESGPEVDLGAGLE